MKLSWKIILIGGGFLLLISGVVWGYKQYSFYKEKAAITEKQEEIQDELEKADINHIRTEDDLRRQLMEKERLVDVLDKENARLENQIANIVVPSDPNDLVDAFHRRGFRSAIILNKP
jgi:protein subunit release factor A